MPDTIAHHSFNYRSLDTKTAEFVQQQTTEIKGLFRQSIENILRIGKGLLQVKDRLPHGQWLAWLETEFGWTDRTARNYMQAAEEFRPEMISNLNMAARALYLLASPSTPDAAREEALARAQAGEKITVNTARDLRDKYVLPKSAPEPGTELGLGSALHCQNLQPPEAQRPAAQSYPQFASPSSVQTPPRVEPTTALSRRRRATEEKPSVVSLKQVQPGEWWKLGNDNYLYCGDPTSLEFQKLLPEEIALSLVSPLNPETWPQSLSPNAVSTASVFTPYQEDQDLSLLREIMERYIQLYTEGGDAIALSFLPDPAILPLVEQLECRFFCADPDPKRCDAAITVWTTLGLSAEKLPARQGGKKRGSRLVLA